MKKLVTSYTFDASAQTITSDDFTSLEKIQLITNVTDQIIIYNFADTTKGGSLTSTTLTLEYDTTSMDDGDKLQILVEDGAAVQPVSGTFYQATQPVSGTVAATQSGTWDEVGINDSGNSITVDGTVTAELSATDNAVLDDIAANQTDASQKTQIVDGSGNVIGATSNALDVNIKSGASAGTQYTEADTDSSITGTAIMWEDASETLRAVSAVKPLPISDAGGALTVDGTVAVTGTFWQATQPVSGTVTANAGTNLNTSALALETGGNLATIAGKDFATQTTLAAINAKLVTGTDIGDVTINNASIAVTQSGTWDEVGINDSGNSITVDNGGTFAVQATLAAETTKVIGTINVAASQTIAVTQATAGNLNCTEASGAAIKTAVEALDNSVDGNYLNTNLNYAGTDAATGNGTAAGSLRVSLASDSTGIVSLTTSTAAIGRVGHDITGIGHGVKTVTTAGTDVALAASTACKKVDIQAQTDNTSLIAVGGSGVDATVATGTGIVLNPGETYSFEIDNLADIYIDSLVNGEGVRFTYYT